MKTCRRPDKPQVEVPEKWHNVLCYRCSEADELAEYMLWVDINNPTKGSLTYDDSAWWMKQPQYKPIHEDCLWIWWDEMQFNPEEYCMDCGSNFSDCLCGDF
jgi:hypothetical protein